MNSEEIKLAKKKEWGLKIKIEKNVSQFAFTNDGKKISYLIKEDNSIYIMDIEGYSTKKFEQQPCYTISDADSIKGYIFQNATNVVYYTKKRNIISYDFINAKKKIIINGENVNGVIDSILNLNDEDFAFVVIMDTRHKIKIWKKSEPKTRTVMDVSLSDQILSINYFMKEEALYILNWDESISSVLLLYPNKKYKKKFLKITDFAYDPSGEKILTCDNLGYIFMWIRTSCGPKGEGEWEKSQ